MVIETVATFGLMFFLFAVGVTMDPVSIIRPGKKALAIAFSSFFSTLVVCGSLAFLLTQHLVMQDQNWLPLIALSQSFSAFPVVACLLTELKMLTSDIGRLTLSTSMVCDALGISLSAITIAFAGNGNSKLAPLWSVGSMVALIAAVVHIVRPILQRMIKRVPSGKPIGESWICAIFVSVLLTGLLSEVIGQHYVLGPLVFGIVVPEGPPLGASLVSKLDAFSSGLFYPSYLAISGLRTNIFKVHFQSFWVVAVIVLSGCMVKVCVVMVVAIYNEMTVRDAFIVALIMNAKGVSELMLYNVLRNAQVLTDEGFTLAVIVVMVITAIITTLITFFYDSSGQYTAIKRSTIQHCHRQSDLRILVCTHSQENVCTIINLLEISHAPPETHISVIGIALVELEGRRQPMLIPHEASRTERTNTTGSDQIINALTHYELQSEGSASVEAFTCISPFEITHNDICRVAIDKRATIVIVPFHKQWAIDGSIESVNRGIKAMNLKVLESAPCSVGILIDRGVLNGSMSLVVGHPLYHVAVIYLGGVDDAESLAYGARMTDNEKVDLTVVRFLIFGAENTKDRKLESDLINEYREANAGNERFVIVEEVVRNGVDLSASIREMADCFDLILVGRHHQDSPLLYGLGDWSECPELGVIGDMLASPDLGITASVLVIQQQKMGRLAGVGDRDQHVRDVLLDERTGGSWAISMDRTSTSTRLKI
uniref:Cation/H+ exchanger domain-containing protein n=2 Tax=Quercus lobata TaxID=97700 RepID=A0A7N2MF57_QUELO